VIERLAAVAAAIALIAGAFVIRENVIDDGSNAGTGSQFDEIVCAAELPDDVCGREEPVATTADALIASPDRSITWVTPGPWPEMVNEARRGEGVVFPSATPVASTTLMVVVRRMPPECEAALTWECLGDAAQSGASRISGPPRSTSTRLLAKAAMLSSYLGDDGYAINEVRDDPAVFDWIVAATEGVERGRRFQATSLADFLAIQGSADVFITTEAETRGLRLSAGYGIGLPEPHVRMVATVGSRGEPAKAIAERLLRAGWDAATQAGENDGLPSPGVLLALREVGS
jgi:hypothetical protein